MRLGGRGTRIGLAVTTAVSLSGGVTYAVTAPTAQAVKACATKANVLVLPSGGKCAKGTHAVSIGAPGDIGPPGPPGTTGAPGQPGGPGAVRTTFHKTIPVTPTAQDADLATVDGVTYYLDCAGTSSLVFASLNAAVSYTTSISVDGIVRTTIGSNGTTTSIIGGPGKGATEPIALLALNPSSASSATQVVSPSIVTVSSSPASIHVIYATITIKGATSCSIDGVLT